MDAPVALPKSPFLKRSRWEKLATAQWLLSRQYVPTLEHLVETLSEKQSRLRLLGQDQTCT